MKYYSILSDHPLLQNNYIFNNTLSRDDLSLFGPLIYLKNELKKIGGDLNTNDYCINEGIKVNAVIHLDPNEKPNYIPNQINIGVFIESKYIKKYYRDKSIFSHYDLVLYWDNLILEQYKDKSLLQYIPFNFEIDTNFSIPYQSRRYKISAVSSNKNLPLNFKNNLYEERIKIYRYLNDNYPSDFHLFGRGWATPTYKANFKNALIRRSGLERLININYPSNSFSKVYKSNVDDKFNILENSIFNICFENILDQNNYITEKIFQPLLTRTIPIYYGAPNILEFVPSKCFISYRDFSSYKDLSDEIINMSTKKLEEYRENIDNFVKFDLPQEFACKKFSENIINATRNI